MEEKVVASFHITAYNCEKYIEKTIDSILNQSEPRWILVVGDNGSTDKTGDIIRSYAEKDSRIIAWSIDKNRDFESEQFFKERARVEKFVESKKPEYFAMLDADDFYHPDFLKKSYERALETGVDMVVSGTVMFQDVDDTVSMIRIPPELKCIDNFVGTADFIKLYGSLRTVWGKLISNKYSSYFRKECLADLPTCIQSGQDTYKIMKLMNKIETFSSIGEALHYYRIRSGSDSRGKIIPKSRVDEGIVLNDLATIVTEKYGVKCRDTEVFLSEVLVNHVKDAVNLVKISEKMSLAQKISYLRGILNNRKLIENVKVNGTLKDLMSYVYESGLQICNNAKIKDKDIPKLIVDLSTDVISQEGMKILEEVMNIEEMDLHKMFKADLIVLVEKGDFEWANQLVDQILADRPLDTEAMYFKLYMSYVSDSPDWKFEFLKNLIFKGENELNSELRERIIQDLIEREK